MDKPTVTVYADPNCSACHGRGTVSDWVPTPFGIGNCEMITECECVFLELTEEDNELIESGQMDLIVEPAPEYFDSFIEVGDDD